MSQFTKSLPPQLLHAYLTRCIARPHAMHRMQMLASHVHATSCRHSCTQADACRNMRIHLPLSRTLDISRYARR